MTNETCYQMKQRKYVRVWGRTGCSCEKVSGKDKWTGGKIIQREGPLNYKVETTPGNIWKRHADQIRKSDFCDTTQSVIDPDIIIPETTIIEKQPDAKSSDIVIPTTEPAPRRYPLRIRKPVDKLDLWNWL